MNDEHRTLVCVGTARMSGATGGGETRMILEVDVDLDGGGVSGVRVYPPMSGLNQLLGQALLGRPFTQQLDAADQLLSERYVSPFKPAVRAALRTAVDAYRNFRRQAEGRASWSD